jgi:serine/threonine protein kinase
LFKNITNNSLDFPSTQEVVLTDACKDLLLKLLEKDPTRRLGIKNGIKDIKDHIFFQGVDWEKVARKEVFDMPKAYLAEMALSII